jgi:hypothetical protein
MHDMELIDHYIKILREVFSSCSIYFEDFNTQILNFLSIDNIAEYNFIIDSLYLLEDTQLAKQNYKQYDLTGPTKLTDFGEIYLRLYGILNACYLQRQALIECGTNLKVDLDTKNISSAPIFEYRKIFAAHTVNVDYDKRKHSYILDRHALKSNEIKGYTSNSLLGLQFKDAKLNELVQAWDSILASKLNQIVEFVLDKSEHQEFITEDLKKLRAVFNRIKNTINNRCRYIDIWDSTPICITGI